MQKLDLDFLSLIIGLSVYVSSIRFLVISRLMADPPPCANRKEKYKKFLKWLIPADVLFVISGILLMVILFWGNLFDPNGCPPAKAPEFFSTIVIWTFIAGVLYLVIHHTASWVKTLRS